MLMFMYDRIVILLLSAILIAVNVLHPFLHAFEGGLLDANLAYANAWAGLFLNDSSGR